MLIKRLLQEQQNHCCLFQFALEFFFIVLPQLKVLGFFFTYKLHQKYCREKEINKTCLLCAAVSSRRWKLEVHVMQSTLKLKTQQLHLPSEWVCWREHEPPGKGEHRRLFCPDLKEIHFSQGINSDCTTADLKRLILVCVCFWARISRGFN